MSDDKTKTHHLSRCLNWSLKPSHPCPHSLPVANWPTLITHHHSSSSSLIQCWLKAAILSQQANRDTIHRAVSMVAYLQTRGRELENPLVNSMIVDVLASLDDMRSVLAGFMQAFGDCRHSYLEKSLDHFGIFSDARSQVLEVYQE